MQKEVIEATLAADFGVEVGFRESTTICVERLAGTGAAVERLHQPPNPFLATIGLRVEPAAAGSGVKFGIEVELGSMPIAFFRAVEDTVRETLQQGIYGWEVTDCRVAMTHSGYLGKQSLGHQRFAKSLSSTGEDYPQADAAGGDGRAAAGADRRRASRCTTSGWTSARHTLAR